MGTPGGAQETELNTCNVGDAKEGQDPIVWAVALEIIVDVLNIVYHVGMKFGPQLADGG